MNKDGFTLTELLAVIAIIGIISLIAIPNIVNISEGVKSTNMLDDAKRFISLAKSRVNSDYDMRDFSNTEFCSGNSCTFYIMDLNKGGDFKTDDFSGTKKIIDVDGTSYDNNSYVRYYKSGNELKYCIYLRSEKRFLAPKNASGATCVDENTLTTKEIVHVN